MDVREKAGGQVSREWVTWAAGVGGLPQELNKFGSGHQAPGTPSRCRQKGEKPFCRNSNQKT
jgi:hypothetical protein